MCFIYAYMYVCTHSYPAAIVYLSNTCSIQCWVVSDNLHILVSLLLCVVFNLFSLHTYTVGFVTWPPFSYHHYSK